MCLLIGLFSLLIFIENSDYIGETALSVEFLPGHFSGIHRCTNVTLLNDIIVEYDEEFEVILKENSSRLEVNHERNTTHITILEDEDDCKSSNWDAFFFKGPTN